MDFYEVLEQVLVLLQRHGRVSYRALKRQFNLDDDALDDLKEELLYAHPIRDDEGRGLIWTADVDTTAAPVSISQPQRSTAQEEPSTQPEPPPLEPIPPEAERRQLTVMFCDLADSTRLSGQLDPEDLRDVIRAYQSTSAEVIERYDGYIAQHLGDGLMVYFGWPQAHEDDAQRAIHAGLGILAAMQGLNTRLEQEKGVCLVIRIGIHTGLVVVGEIGQGASQEHLALGETPNIASRIEGVAEPDTVAISDTTYRLIQGYFVCEDLGRHMLRGVDDAQQVYRVVRESDVHSRFNVAAARGLTPLVGRESETVMLFERWEQVKEGQGQVILLSGEAGIGKSRLLQVLRDHVADEPHIRLECRSSPYYQNTALYPITDMFQRVLNWRQDDTPQAKLDKLAQTLRAYRLVLDEAMPLFANLLSLPMPENHYPPLNMSPQRQRQKTFEITVAMLLQQTERQPVLFILEDLHWTDPSTLELLGLLIDQAPTTPICVLLTCRPNFQPPWGSRSYLSQVTLSRLSRNQIEHMAGRVAGGKRLPNEVLQQIVAKTDGVPLFVEEMTKAILESGVLKATNEHYEPAGYLTTLTIPATLQDSLMARLDRLVTAKAVAQYAAVIGRQFSYGLLQAVSELDEVTLQRELSRLVEAELLYQRGLPPQAIYIFKHALIQDAAYQALLKSTRQQYHRRIAQTLEERFPETAENQPELLAHHYTEAGLHGPAIGYWQQAGEKAIQRSAHAEAINHLNKGLELLETLPDTSERIQQELGLQMALGPALMAAKGPAAHEVEQTYARAQTLCQQGGDTPQLFIVLRGLWRLYNQRPALRAARELGEQLLALAQQQHDPSRLLVAHQALGVTLHFLGEFVPSLSHLERGMAFTDQQAHHVLAVRYGGSPGVYCFAYAASTLWLLGYPEQALWRGHESLTLAQELSHPLSLAFALYFTARLHQLRREAKATQTQAEATMSLASEQGFPYWMGIGMIMRGWALATQGQREGVAQVHQGMTAVRTTGAEVFRPLGLTLLAEAYKTIRQDDEGLRMLTEALVIADKTEQRYYDAELYRLKGELLLSQSPNNAVEAVSCFQRALDIARSQQARSWELRAATSLARLWQSQGKRQEAYELLAPVYGWFTEGFDTADLQDARALLDELG